MTLTQLLSNNATRDGKPRYIIYKAYWPDGAITNGWGEEYKRRVKEYADYEADLDHAEDYDEEGNDYGVTRLVVFSKNEDIYDQYD